MAINSRWSFENKLPPVKIFTTSYIELTGRKLDNAFELKLISLAVISCSISEVRHFAAILSIQFLVSIKKKERKKEREKYMELPSAISLNNSTCIQWLNTLTVCSQAFNTLGLKAFKFISVLQFWSRSFNIYTIKAKLWWSIPKRKRRLLFKSNRTGLTVSGLMFHSLEKIHSPTSRAIFKHLLCRFLISFHGLSSYFVINSGIFRNNSKSTLENSRANKSSVPHY